jgi:hypothetical protein
MRRDDPADGAFVLVARARGDARGGARAGGFFEVKDGVAGSPGGQRPRSAQRRPDDAVFAGSVG